MKKWFCHLVEFSGQALIIYHNWKFSLKKISHFTKAQKFLLKCKKKFGRWKFQSGWWKFISPTKFVGEMKIISASLVKQFLVELITPIKVKINRPTEAIQFAFILRKMLLSIYIYCQYGDHFIRCIFSVSRFSEFRFAFIKRLFPKFFSKLIQ